MGDGDEHAIAELPIGNVTCNGFVSSSLVLKLKVSPITSVRSS